MTTMICKRGTHSIVIHCDTFHLCREGHIPLWSSRERLHKMITMECKKNNSHVCNPVITYYYHYDKHCYRKWTVRVFIDFTLRSNNVDLAICYTTWKHDFETWDVTFSLRLMWDGWGRPTPTLVPWRQGFRLQQGTSVGADMPKPMLDLVLQIGKEKLMPCCKLSITVHMVLSFTYLNRNRH